MGMKLTFTKIKKKIPTDQPSLQTQGWVMTNKQFFKSSLMIYNFPAITTG